ncbi:S41 family peptidase [Bacteroides sp.]|uniref:S41 family peptidase n=1 Tax=Bacteroides sp. TaxID=29523 RepID=UPI002618E5CA|nr:S41 family peptidase [Bacteroides sp.]MDD3037871.1 S41 family peptidase [Bacteroides sp.]
MIAFNRFTFYSLLLLLGFTACQKDEDLEQKPPVVPPAEATAYVQRVNNFISQCMNRCYLWNELMPDIDWKYEYDSKAYFEKLLSEEDHFSYITDDLEGFLNSSQGIETTFGYSLAYQWRNDEQTKICAVVEYVYPNSPAANANIKRGDLILSLDDQDITLDNMYDLINKSSIKVGVSKYKDGQFLEPESMSLKQVVLTQNTVHTAQVLDIEGTKVGYLFYTSFIENFNSSLDKVFADFKKVGVSELILDLRYNFGGDEKAIINLCSHIAPAGICQSENIIISKIYNSILTDEMKENGSDVMSFTDASISDNLNLTRVFILTSDQTYSASEVTLVGLAPYMDVIQIGEKTGGKYTGMKILMPLIEVDGDIYLDPVIGNWGVLPIILRYQNKNGEDPKGGLIPNHEVASFYLPMFELGDKQDPLIAKAVEIISGRPQVSARGHTGQSVEKKPFCHISSKFDEIKKNLFVK